MAAIVEYIVKAIKIQIESLMPVSLDKECEKATKMIKGFLLNDKLEILKNTIMSPDAINTAKGLIFLTVGKVGASFTIRGGSGIIIARLPDGTWSAPAAIKTGGCGLGSQFGAEILEIVMVLPTEESVKNFFELENITLGGNVSAAIGDLGRVAEINTTVKKTSSIISYGKSKGAFLGVSVEGSVIQQNNEANYPIYGKEVTVEDVLSGKVPKPEFAHELYEVLKRCEEASAAASNQKKTKTLPPEKQPLIQPVVTQVNKDQKRPL